MRLINPGAGEISDRLCILALKIVAGGDAGKDVGHFITEQAALLTAIRTRTLNGKWFEAVLALAAVNAFLWQAEDDLRHLRDVGAARSAEGQEEAGEIAFRIQALNDRRAVLVQQINQEAGDPADKEKL